MFRALLAVLLVLMLLRLLMLLMAHMLGLGWGGRRDRAKRDRRQKGGFHRQSPTNRRKGAGRCPLAAPRTGQWPLWPS